MAPGIPGFAKEVSMNSWLTWGYWYMFLLLKELSPPDGLPARTHPLGRGVFNETPSRKSPRNPILVFEGDAERGAQWWGIPLHRQLQDTEVERADSEETDLERGSNGTRHTRSHVVQSIRNLRSSGQQHRDCSDRTERHEDRIFRRRKWVYDLIPYNGIKFQTLFPAYLSSFVQIFHLIYNIQYGYSQGWPALIPPSCPLLVLIPPTYLPLPVIIHSTCQCLPEAPHSLFTTHSFY